MANAIGAAKTYYMLNKLTPDLRNELDLFIRGFQDGTGHIFDRHYLQPPNVRSLIWYCVKFKPRQLRDYLMRRHELMKRALTRGAFAGFMCLNSRPDIPYMQIPYTCDEIEKYIHKLDWTQPWGAASHTSHLVFFLRQNERLFHIHERDVEELIEYVFSLVNAYRHEDGAWYTQGINIPLYQKINGCMKMMLAFESAEREDVGKEKEMIDLCLSAINDEHACNNLNIVLVLYHCHKQTDYRKAEIRDYCRQRLEMFSEFYWPEYGGFSFYRGQASSSHYGARMSEGRAEPDMHGTVLFLWGITLISDILGFRKELDLVIPYT